MNRFKKFLASLLTVVTLLSMLPTFVFADDDAVPAPTAVPAEIAAVEDVNEPTAEPAAEIAAEPVEEVNEEPIVEEPAVEEPTEEPAVEEPTEEPAVEEPTEEPAVEEPTEEPAVEEPTEEPAVEEPVVEEPTEEPTEEPAVEEPTEEPVVEEPTEEPAVEEPAVKSAEEDADEKSGIDEDAISALPEELPEDTFVPKTPAELAYYFDESIAEIAERLEMTEEEFAALSEEEIVKLFEKLSIKSVDKAYAGNMSLDVTIYDTAYSSSTRDYKISISRSGRYVLYLTTSKYMQVDVYDQYGKYVDGAIHYKGTNATWCVDLTGGNTYTFKFKVDTRYEYGTCSFNSKLRLYTDGSYKDRAVSLAYDNYTTFNVKHANDFRIYCFTAAEGSKYRITTTGSMYRTVEVYNSSLSLVKTGTNCSSGTRTFDVTLTPGQTYYVYVHGQSYSGGIYWHKTGSGQIKLECLDKLVNPITFSVNKTTVNPGLNDSVQFTVSTKYASKVRLVVDGRVVAGEYKVSGNKATFNASFHVSGKHSVQVQGYYNNSWSLLSPAKTITVNNKSALGTPVFSSVFNNQGSAAAGEGYYLHWNQLNNASQYCVYVYCGDEMIYTTTVTDTTVTIPGTIFATTGIYIIEVYGLADNYQQSSNPGHAEITVQTQAVKMSTTATVKGRTITWNLTTKDAPTNTQFKFDLYKIGYGLVKSGSYAGNKSFSYTVSSSGNYFVIVTAKYNNTMVQYVSPATYVMGIEKPSGIVLDQSGTVKVNIGATLQLSYHFEPYGSHDDVSWSSSSSKVATVTANGVVVPKKTGTVTITVKTAGGKKDTVKVKVVDEKKPSKVELDQSGTVEVYLGYPLQLHATLNPSNALTILKWSSSSSKVASVDQNGLVTPKKVGTATITVKTYNGKKDTVKVKVVDPAPQSISLDIRIKKGQSLQLSPSTNPGVSINHTTLTWTSSNTNVVTVDSQGNVYAAGTGTATVTVKTHNGKKDSMRITVY